MHFARNVSEHSRRWGVLLRTVSALQAMLKGFLEGKLLELIKDCVLKSQKHHRLAVWSEIPFLRDLDMRLRATLEFTVERERRLSQAATTIQSWWKQRMKGGA